MERHIGAGDGCRAGAAIGLDDVAVEGDLALPERFQVGHGAERAPDEALDLLRAPALAPARGLAGGPRPGRARQHAVFAGHPAPPLVAQEGGHAILQACRAQHLRVAEANQAGALGVLAHAGLKLDLAQLVRPDGPMDALKVPSPAGGATLSRGPEGVHYCSYPSGLA